MDLSQSPQLLILNYLVSDTFPNGEGGGKGEGEHKKYLLHLKRGKGKELCLHSPHSTSLSNGTMLLLKWVIHGHLHSECKHCS